MVNNISVLRLIIFILVCIVALIIYYKKILKADDKPIYEVKDMKVGLFSSNK